MAKFEFVVKVEDSHWSLFDKKIKKYNKICTKLGINQFEVNRLYTIEVFKQEFSDSYMKRVDGKMERMYHIKKVKYFVYHIIGEENIKISGWSFIGNIKFDQGKEYAMVTAVPGKEIPQTYFQFKDQSCQHCNKKRYRKSSYILQNESGKYIHVGLSCLKDFLGHESIKDIIELLNMEHSFAGLDDEPSYSYGYNRVEYLDPTMITKIVYKYIKMFGFQNSSDNYPTKDQIYNFLQYTFGLIPHDQISKTKKLDYETILDFSKGDINEDVFSKIKSYISTLNKDGNSYNSNINNLFNHSTQWMLKDLGFVCAAINQFIKFEFDEKNTNKRESKHIGYLKQRVVLTVNIQTVKVVESEWGCSWLHKCTDKDGNKISFFNKNRLGEIGDKINIKGTVKNHFGDRSDSRETVLNRVVTV
ncbi:MAG: hypothetical protein KC589_02705 [Nanoarchaeota archaeon]|nr:hypothetical protein [Nanoarchaeota archaeon]